MKLRPLGNTGMHVSEIGLGAWQLANPDWGVNDNRNEALSIVHKSLEAGCNFFDTAPGYGGGRSEELFGIRRMNAVAAASDVEHKETQPKKGKTTQRYGHA